MSETIFRAQPSLFFPYFDFFNERIYEYGDKVKLRSIVIADRGATDWDVSDLLFDPQAVCVLWVILEKSISQQ